MLRFRLRARRNPPAWYALYCPPQAKLQGQIGREKALAEAEGRAKEARENEDINRRASLLRYQEEVRLARCRVVLVQQCTQQQHSRLYLSPREGPLLEGRSVLSSLLPTHTLSTRRHARRWRSSTQ